MMFGKLTIFVSGNKAEIDNITPKEMGLALGDYVRERLGSDAKTISHKPVLGGESSLDKLKKLGELKDAGVITEQEFNDQKAKLLESI